MNVTLKFLSSYVTCAPRFSLWSFRHSQPVETFRSHKFPLAFYLGFPDRGIKSRHTHSFGQQSGNYQEHEQITFNQTLKHKRVHWSTPISLPSEPEVTATLYWSQCTFALSQMHMHLHTSTHTHGLLSWAVGHQQEELKSPEMTATLPPVYQGHFHIPSQDPIVTSFHCEQCPFTPTHCFLFFSQFLIYKRIYPFILGC